MQYQFLLNNLKNSDQIQSEIVELGVAVDNIHFVSERSDDYAGHQVKAASIIEERDVVHKIVRGAIVGMIAGAVLSTVLFYSKPYGWQVEMINSVFILFLTTGFGGWIGGLVGISHRNYRITNLEKELQQGKAIMLVYTDEAHAGQIKQIITAQHPDAAFVGQDDAFDNPLRNVKTAHVEH